jgi:hypothetical protein
MASRRQVSAADDGVDVVEMTADEYQAAAQRSLADLGLTYAELAWQARAGHFASADAADLWALIRGTLPDGAGSRDGR